jgi:hypothetical protein
VWEPWLYIKTGYLIFDNHGYISKRGINFILFYDSGYVSKLGICIFFLMIEVINFGTRIDTRGGLGAQFLMPTPLG